MNENKQAIDFLGQVLMERIRDEAIDEWERIFRCKMRS